MAFYKTIAVALSIILVGATSAFGQTFREDYKEELNKMADMSHYTHSHTITCMDEDALHKAWSYKMAMMFVLVKVKLSDDMAYIGLITSEKANEKRKQPRTCDEAALWEEVKELEEYISYLTEAAVIFYGDTEALMREN